MDIRVDADGLRAAGVGLCATEAATAPAPVCQPAAADPVSTGLAAWFSGSAAAVGVLMGHAAQQRAAGGISVSSTAGALQSTDERNAAAITAAVAGQHPAAAADAVIPGGGVPDIPVPAVPVPPVLSPPAALTGEQVAALVHGGPGAQGFRSFADSLRSTVAPQVRSAADETRQHAAGIGQHWIDGHQQAAHNAAAHADWLDNDLHAHVLRLAESADSAAEHAQTLIANTPRPEDFAELHNRLNAAVANWQASGGINAAPVLALSQQIAHAQADAVAGYQRYYAAAATTSTTAPPLPKPAPPIHKGGNKTAAPTTGDGQGRSSDADSDPELGAAESGGDEPGGDTPQDTLGTGASALAQTQTPATFPGQPPAAAAGQSPMGQQAAGMAAGLAGTLLGAGVGSVGQLAGSLGGLANAPLSALSGLGSLPGMGELASASSHMPQFPSDLGQGFDPGTGSDGGGDPFDSGGTSPSGGADLGDLGGGGDAGGPPVSSSAPAASAGGHTGAAGVSPAGTSTPARPGPAAGGGGMGMMPPMMGGGGRPDDDGRGKYAGEDQRVVLRQTPNTEAVFGEVERTRSPRKRRTQEGDNA